MILFPPIRHWSGFFCVGVGGGGGAGAGGRKKYFMDSCSGFFEVSLGIL